MEHIVIIGNGIAGITAARHIRKLSDKKITVISAESNHFFSRTALMYVYMGHMRWRDIEPYESWFWKKNRIGLKNGYVTKVDTVNKTLHFADSETLAYDKLIIASGSVTQKYGWEGQDLKGVVGMVTKQDLENIEKYAPNHKECPRAVIVGGGLIGVELAEMLRTRDIAVTILVREAAFWGSVLPSNDAEMISRHIISHGVNIKHGTSLEKILGDEYGHVRAVITGNGEEIPCNLVGIATGVKPNISFLKDSEVETDKGILVDRNLRTSAKDIYAIGDCAQRIDPIGHRPSVEAVWYTGRMMGEALAQTVCGNPTEYKPGNWFNSAKFFDIEYQTYGWVFPEKKKKENEAHFHWKHNDNTKAITIAYNSQSREFLGINTFGIRMRHEVFDSWLNEKRSIDYVVQHLNLANFDPEFFEKHQNEIKKEFKDQISTVEA